MKQRTILYKGKNFFAFAFGVIPCYHLFYNILIMSMYPNEHIAFLTVGESIKKAFPSKEMGESKELYKIRSATSAYLLS